MNTYSPEGTLIHTHRNYEYTSSLKGLEKAAEKQITLEAPAILCDQNFDLHVSLPCKINAVIPRNEVQYCKPGEITKDIAILTRVGKTVCFKVVGFKSNVNGDPCVILSRRAAQLECMNRFISDLIPGDIIPAKITHMENFGAFADIGCGIISLLSIDCISVSRISHPSIRFTIGSLIYAVIKNIDSLGRIYISQRELQGSWEENAAMFTEGETVKGVVRSVENYGIFVELKPNLAGLAEYRPNIKQGQIAAVYIKSIIPEKMKIKLIMIDARDDNNTIQEPEYFIDTTKISHIDTWKYSPPSCKKIIESIFS